MEQKFLDMHDGGFLDLNSIEAINIKYGVFEVYTSSKNTYEIKGENEKEAVIKYCKSKCL